GSAIVGMTVGHVEDVHGERQRDTVGGGVGIEAGAEVCAFDATGLEHIGPVGAVTRVGTGGLSGHLGVVGVGRRAGVARSAGGGTFACTVAAAGGPARGGGTCNGGIETTASRDHGGDVEGQALILDVLARPDEPSALPGRQM